MAPLASNSMRQASDWAFLVVRGAPKAATALVGAAMGRKDVEGVIHVVKASGGLGLTHETHELTSIPPFLVRLCQGSNARACKNHTHDSLA